MDNFFVFFRLLFFCFVVVIIYMTYTSNGYIVPAKFAFQFLPRMKNVPKRTKLYLNEIGLTNTDIFKSEI